MSVTYKISLSNAIGKELMAMALMGGKIEQLYEELAGDLRDEIISHIRAVKVPGQHDGIEYWQQVASNIEADATKKDALLTFTKVGVRLHWYGGWVYPGKSLALSGPNKGKPTKALALPFQGAPIAGGAYQRPVFAGLLAFIRAAKGGETIGYLVEGHEKTITRGKNKGEKRIVPNDNAQFLYTLRTSHYTRPDKTFLPTDARISDILTDSTARFLDYVASF